VQICGQETETRREAGIGRGQGGALTVDDYAQELFSVARVAEFPVDQRHKFLACQDVDQFYAGLSHSGVKSLLRERLGLRAPILIAEIARERFEACERSGIVPAVFRPFAKQRFTAIELGFGKPPKPLDDIAIIVEDRECEFRTFSKRGLGVVKQPRVKRPSLGQPTDLFDDKGVVVGHHQSIQIAPTIYR